MLACVPFPFKLYRFLIPCIITSFFTDIGYIFNGNYMATMSLSRNMLSNIIAIYAVSAKLDFQRELDAGIKVVMSSNYGKEMTVSPCESCIDI